MPEIKYEITQSIACLSEEKNVSWNGNAPKYDIRSWSADHSKMGKGITLTKEELVQLASVLRELL